MTTYGLTADGLVIKTTDIIRQELEDSLRSTFGLSIRLGDKSILGQIVGILAERYASLWELIEVVYSSGNVDRATGSALDALALLTGTFRPEATYSTVALVLTGDPTTVVPADREVRTTSTQQRFLTSDNVTITAVAAHANSTAYVIGDRVTNMDRVYECIASGTSGPNGPTSTGEDILDNGTLHWTYLGEGTGAADVTGIAVNTGPTEAFARDITTITNQVAGWQSVINLTDANQGRDLGTDAELRILREAELATGGSSPVDALRAELLNVTDVVAVTIFVNNTDSTNSDGLPPHSIEALVRGPETPDADFDQSIFDTLLAGVAAGVQTYALPGGNPVTGTAIDSEGTAHTMNFSRPENVNIYVDISLIIDEDEYPIDGDDQVKAAIVAWGDAQNTGKNAVSKRIAAAAFEVPGVLDVVYCYIDDAPAPATDTTIQISLRQLAVYDTSRITVSTTAEVP